VAHLSRPFLHAARLVFAHPADGRRMEFDSPLPEDLQHVLDELTEQIHGDRLYDPRVRG
jgi:23S rRNA pseudouridine1911/1915/1917 synthase